MTSLELALRTLVAIWLVLATCYVTLRCTEALELGGSLVLRVIGFTTVGTWGSAAAFHLLLMMGGYNLPGALALSFVACAAAYYASRGRTPTLSLLRRVRRVTGRLAGRIARSPHRARLGFFFFSAMLLAVRILPVSPYGHDTLVYHGTKAAMWVQQGKLDVMWGPGQWAVYSLYPAGAELFTSLAILPFHNDLYATLVDLLMWLGTGVAAFALHRELRLREPYSSIGAGFVMAIPVIRLLIATGYVEPALCFMFLLASYLVVRFAREGRPTLALLAIAALGLTASVKFSMMLPAAVGALVVFVRAVFLRTGRVRALLCAAAGTLCAMAVVFPWLWNSFRHTGYPLSPLPLKMAGITLGVSREVEWFMQNIPFPPPYQWDSEWPLAKETFRFPGGMIDQTIGVFCVVPLLLAPFGWLRMVRRRPWPTVALTLMTMACAYTYLEPHMAQVRFVWREATSRFLLPTICLVVPAALACASYRRGTRNWLADLLWVGVVVNTFAYGYVSVTDRDVRGALFVLALLVAIVRASQYVVGRWGRDQPRVALAVAAAGCVVFSTSLFVYKDSRRYQFIRDGLMSHPWWPAVEALDSEPERTRLVAITSSPALPCVWPAYPFLGHNLQNRLTYVSPLPGTRLPGFCPSDGWEPGASFNLWLRRLQEQGIEDVVSFDVSATEYGWMVGNPALFEPVTLFPNGGYFRRRPAVPAS